jgi:hypothetical protein
VGRGHHTPVPVPGEFDELKRPSKRPDFAAVSDTRCRVCVQVTTPVETDDCPVVARTGRWSIFAALQECCPSAVRNDDPYIGKYGMTEIELNKVLEKNSFVKIRDRSSGGGGDDEVRALRLFSISTCLSKNVLKQQNRASHVS